jgi:hypothetical protein
MTAVRASAQPLPEQLLDLLRDAGQDLDRYVLVAVAMLACDQPITFITARVGTVNTRSRVSAVCRESSNRGPGTCASPEPRVSSQAGLGLVDLGREGRGGAAHGAQGLIEQARHVHLGHADLGTDLALGAATLEAQVQDAFLAGAERGDQPVY